MELFEASERISSFVKQIQELYGLCFESFNVHILLHACDCVSRWVPIWAYSAYGFEDENGKLKNLYNGQ